MTAQITINDPQDNTVLLTGLQLGDFFRFPTSADGKAYVVIEFVRCNGSSGLSRVRYRKLDDGEVYSTSAGKNTRVNKLRLASAELELEAGR